MSTQGVSPLILYATRVCCLCIFWFRVRLLWVLEIAMGCSTHNRLNHPFRAGVGNLWHVCHTWHAKQFLMPHRGSMFHVSILLDSQRRYIYPDLYQTTYAVCTQNDLKRLGRRTVGKRLPIPILEYIWPLVKRSWLKWSRDKYKT